MKALFQVVSTNFVFVLFTFIFGTTVLAVEFPERTDGNTEVIYLEKHDIDYALRTWLLSNAKHSIKMVGFSHGADNIGFRLVSALRVALANGVRVQYAYEKPFSFFEGGDYFDSVPTLLADAAFKHPAEVITCRNQEKQEAGLAINDFVHEKMIIIDEGTPNETIFIGGRGSTDLTETFLDSAYILRPVDYTKAYVGTDIVSYFNSQWRTLRTIFDLTVPRKLPWRLREWATEAPYPASYPIAKSSQNEFDEMKSLLSAPAVQSQELAPFQFRPIAAQFVSNDFHSRLLELGEPPTLSLRPSLEDNDITRFLEKLTNRSTRVRLTSYSFAPPARLREAFINLVKRGGEIDFFTNSRESHKGNSPFGMSVDFTLRYLISLYEKGRDFSGRIRTFLFNPKKSVPVPGEPNHIYVHRKDGVYDDTVVAGSFNMTESSGTKNSEVIVALRDPRLARKINQQLDAEVVRYFQPASSPDLRKEIKPTGWFSKSGLCNFIIKTLF